MDISLLVGHIKRLDSSRKLKVVDW